MSLMIVTLNNLSGRNIPSRSVLTLEPGKSHQISSIALFIPIILSIDITLLLFAGTSLN